VTEPSDGGTRLLWGSIAGALILHAVLAFGGSGLRGGADLLPHLWLIREMSESPAVRTVYAPAYHVIGGLLSPWLGLEVFTRAFAFAAAGALIAGFRSFQRAAGLPDSATVLFAWSPYAFALTWCVPKVEAAGYAVAFWGLGCLLARRYVALALAVAAAFMVHTAAGLFLGLGGGVLALSRRDSRSLSALAAGAALASPLFAAHIAAGCSLAQSFLLSSGDYLRQAGSASSLDLWDRILVLAGPLGLGAAVVGAPSVWRRDRGLALLCALVVALYSNELWLAPFGAGTTLNLLRGLTLLAFATAVCGGVALAARPRVAALVLLSCVIWSSAAAVWMVPQACFVRSFSEAEPDSIRVDRCTFRWRKVGPLRTEAGTKPQPRDRPTRGQ
jgi:hypothetical protein